MVTLLITIDCPTSLIKFPEVIRRFVGLCDIYFSRDEAKKLKCSEKVFLNWIYYWILDGANLNDDETFEY